MPCVAATYSLSVGEEGDDFLPLGGPGDSTSINEECAVRDGMPIFGHAAVRVGVPLEGSPCLSIRKPQVARACQIAVDALDGLPVCWPRVCGETGDSRDGERDIGTGGECCPVESANGLAVRHITHDCVLCCARGCLLDCEPGGCVHRRLQRFEIGEVVAA